MPVKMSERSEEVGEELFDLNKEPVERKRKRSRINNSSEKGKTLITSSRVLRSRTVAMCDGEKQVINMEIVLCDKPENEVADIELGDEIQAPVKQNKGRRGRPRKNPKPEDIRVVSPIPITPHKKRGRGRPPKQKGESGISPPTLSNQQQIVPWKPKRGEGKCSSSQPIDKKDYVVQPKRKRGRPSKALQLVGVVVEKATKKRGRPPKAKNWSNGLEVKKKIVKKNKVRNVGLRIKEKIVSDDERSRGEDGECDLGNAVKVIEHNDEQLGLREQKKLLKDEIVAMLFKAGWTIEYRQRQSRNYHDAIYVDREGRGYWSVTLAYKKLKERIDEGKADDQDLMAFSAIPEETLSMLFRVTQKGIKAGKQKSGLQKRVRKNSSKGKLSDGKNKSRRVLLARRPKTKNGTDSDGYGLYEGTRSLLSWMIDFGTVPLSGKVKYKEGRNKKVLREGRITKEGVCCDCCSVTYKIQDFESHAGSTTGNLYRSMYLDSGNTLFQCLVDSWRKHVELNKKIGFVCVDVEGDDPNDDTCNVCGDGGDLICCDSCPSTFHNGCLGIKVPEGDWHCVYCSCKFCEMPSENTSITDDDDDDNDNRDLSNELLMCCLCEEKFHLHCVDEDFQDGGPSFCGKECLQIFKQLQDLIGVRHELEQEFSYTVLRHHVDSGDDYMKVETNSKLAIAFAVMDECFEPIIDERSGTNMIHNVVYNCGSNIKRLDYSGFYTIILEKGDNIVAAASIRIHGTQLAEMPFIGTRFMYRRQRMCTRLLTVIEMVLNSLGVEKLVIPAISALNKTWTEVFGFFPLEESKRHEMKYTSVIAFPGINMLQKPVKGQPLVEEQKDSAVIASQCTEVEPEHPNVQKSPVPDSSTTQPNNQVKTFEEDHENNNDAAVNSGTGMPVGSLSEIDLNIGAVNVEKSVDNGNCLDHTSEDGVIANACLDLFLSENVKPQSP